MKASVSAMGAVLLALAAQQVCQAQLHPAGPPGYFSPPTSAQAYCSACGPQAQPRACAGGPYDPCCPGPYCVDPWQGFGDFLLLRPANADVAFGIPVATPIGGSGQPALGPTLVADSEYEPGFRVGFARALDESATLGVTYWHLEVDQITNVAVDPGSLTIFPLVIHPSQLEEGATYPSAYGRQDIDFKLIDADYRRVFDWGERHVLSYVIGARYAHLEQDFAASFFAPVAADDQTVFTGIEFDGGGIRLGLEGERRAANWGMLVYGKTAASFVGGEFHAEYIGALRDQLPSVATTWKANRLVSMLDLELGVGWASPGGRLRVTGGYMVSGWFNVVKTADWIRAVQGGDFQGLDDAPDNVLTFDGLVVRTEFRF